MCIRDSGITPEHVRSLLDASAQPGGGAIDPLAALTQLSPHELADRPTAQVRAVDKQPNAAVGRLGLLAGVALALAALVVALRAARR